MRKKDNHFEDETMQTQTYTRYERARIIGARALQISMGAPLLITTTRIDPLEIAIEEFNNNTIPITVKRK
jgi:DNA-directed RNA polymerase subunit K